MLMMLVIFMIMMSAVIVEHLLDSPKERKSLKLYLVRGLPGSGKSWKGDDLLNDGSVDEVVEADQFMYEEKDREMVYNWHTDKIRPAHNDCRLRTFAALENGKNVAVCNTFVARWQMQPYIEFAEKNDIQLEVISLGDSGYDDSGLLKRNVHGVPLETIQTMRSQWEEDYLSADPTPPWLRNKL